MSKQRLMSSACRSVESERFWKKQKSLFRQTKRSDSFGMVSGFISHRGEIEMSKHGKELERKFEERERERREKQGKPIVAPAPKVQDESEERPFVNRA
jgi:hypothetical protein